MRRFAQNNPDLAAVVAKVLLLYVVGMSVWLIGSALLDVLMR